MKTLIFTFILFISIGFSNTYSDSAKTTIIATKKADSPQQKWTVVYTGQPNPSDLLKYDPIALDSDHYPDLSLLKENKKQLLGYISLGEVENYRSWFNKAKNKGILLHENKNWPGSYYANIKNPAWTEMVINDIIPDILHKGFSGIMVDTLDNPIELERFSNTDKYKGMEQATVNLIKAINYHYPNMPIMINRAFEIIPKIAPHITMVLAESTYTEYDFNKNEPRMVSKQLREYYIKTLTKIKKDFPHIQIVTLDYWDLDDTETIKKIYKEQRDLGFVPYVSTIELDRVIEEPKNEK